MENEKENKLLDLDDDYSLFSDARNWILSKKGINKKTQATTYSILGYYAKLSHLLNSYSV